MDEKTALLEGEFDKNDLIRAVIHDVGENPDVVSKIVIDVFENLKKAIMEHKRVEIHGFGVFRQKYYDTVTHGVDPHGHPFSKGPHVKLKFKAAKKFKNDANKKFEIIWENIGF